MTPPLRGLLLTHAPDLAWLQQQLALADAAILKIVTGWGLADGWTNAARAAAARLAPILVVRTVSGDPSVAGGMHAQLAPSRVLEEVRPWWEARDPARSFWVEVGNEPLLSPEPSEQAAWNYQWGLDRSISQLRAAFPGVQIIGPAHMLNHPVALGEHSDGQRRWTAISASALRRCDALATHAYTAEQLRRGVAMLRELVSPTRPIWGTELGLNVALDDAARGRALAGLLASTELAAGIFYHLVHSPGDDPIHFNPHYTLRPGTLAALAATREVLVSPSPVPAPSDADTVLHPQVRVGGFLMDVRQWRTVAAFRAHLAAHDKRGVAPWATGITVHHTAVPTAATWRGAASMRAMARFYTQKTPPWDRGPQIFSVSGAPNPADDGIWQMTPLNARGIHAVSFNATRWGWEVVGDFDTTRWDAGTSALALGGLAALHDWAGWSTVRESTLNGHRDDPKTDKTCPGAAIDIASVRRGVAALLQGKP